MDPILQGVLNFAVWGSLSATLVLGVFSFVQAFVDPPRRARYAVFGLVMGYLAGLDFSRSALQLDPFLYEWLRIWWGALYAGSVLSLLGTSVRTAGAVTVSLLVLGFATYHGVNKGLATTVMFPFAFGVTSLAFAHRAWTQRGYASGILAAFSAAMAAMCACYHAVLQTGKPEVIILGYGHYAEISIIAVLMGWVQLPRELRGQAPVRTHPSLPVALFAAVLGAEGVAMTSLLTSTHQPHVLFILGVVTQIVVALGVFLRHRHQLVIHTDNVSQLLEERTAALQEAKKELARQNELLAQEVGEQARDLQLKKEVIDRQRRLELAAQTAGQVAHDIQNLLSPIFTRIESLQEARTLNEIRELTSDFRKQLEQLLDLNTNLLALARRGRVELLPVRLSELIADIAEKFQGQRLTVEAKDDGWVQGSSAQLTRAVSNLVMNAVESDLDRVVPVTLRSGIADIAQQRRCHLGFLSPGRYAFVEVQDAGPGIPMENLEKIFQPFFSSKSGRHRSGTGLGLTIVSAVVDDHKGVLDLESGPKGTRFTLYFPAIAPPDRPADLGSPSSNATVLVVDDDSSVLAETGTFLEKAGYTVIPAQDGAQAIKTLQSQEVDLVLLDLNMPRMSGLETFLGAMHVRPGIRAVVHSSHVTPEQSLKLKALGVTAILNKPAGRTEILLALRQAWQDRLASLSDNPPK